MAEKTKSHSSLVKNVYLIIGLFISLIFILILIIQVQMNVLTPVRAYIGAEGLWAKAQKDAIRSLEHYAITSKEEDYISFQRFIQVPLGDMKARTELQKPNPGLDLARDGFLAGGNNPEDIEYMINLFLRFQHLSFMSKAIEHWTAGDQIITELNNEAEKLHQAIISGTYKPQTTSTLLARFDVINQHLTEQENQFSLTLANTARLANRISRYITFFFAFVFALLGIIISWPIIIRIRNFEKSMLGNEQRLIDILNISPIAVRIASRHGSEVVFHNQGYADMIKNVHAMGDDPKKYYVRLADYEEVLAELAKGKSVINRQIELQFPDHSTVWTLASYMPMQYKGEDAVLGWFYDITNLKLAEEKIRLLAFHDPLTGLPNRQLLLDRLQQALASSTRSDRNGALLFIDLDNFKSLNDTLGHVMGDMLLQQVAQRLTASVREVDTVARLGGDEFVVMLEDLSEQTLKAAEQAEVVGEKILATLGKLYQLDVHEFRSSASIGTTIFSGDEQNSEELLKQADIAMYQAKRAGRNALRFFDPQMQETINMRVALEGELHKALAQQEFQLYYQVQVDGTGSPIGAEALIRWIHPERGLVSPLQFIPIAEETGLILSIGDWVLDTACAQLKAWEQDALTRNLVLAVNVSARQFHQADFVAQVQATLQRHAINPARLKLELTESMLVKDIESIIATMNTLKQTGIQFSMDDFGTGYSSLQYLMRLPLNQLKIDMSFVRDMGIVEGSNSIVQTIIAMAHSLKLDVIAEGVETEEQREILSFYGCQHYQGYLFSKPVPIEQLEALLKHN